MARLIVAALLFVSVFSVQAEVLKPYVLADVTTGDVRQTSEKVKAALAGNGFEIVGTYQPFPNAIVVCVTNAELKAAATKAENGGFGVVQRVAVTDVGGKLQVSYVNPAYLGTAYGLGKLDGISAKLKAALGAKETFGSVGIDEEQLKPGVYHYAMMMPYFRDVDRLHEHDNYAAAVAAVEKNLAAGEGGTVKVYRVDLPGKEISVFGVGIPKGVIDGPAKGDKDTDKEIMDVVDHKDLKHTAYLPYEVIVDGGRVIALRGRYRIALHFPDTKMAGANGFTKIMSAPWGIQNALERVAGFKRNL